MEFLILVLGFVAMVWAVIALTRGSVYLSIALFIAGTSIFPAEYASLDLMGLSWSCDRVFFLVLLVQAAMSWKREEWTFSRLTNTDLAVGLFAFWLVARTITQPLGSVLPEQPPTLMHLINGYLVPFGLYAVIRVTRLDLKKLRPALLILSCVVGYLAVTAYLEKAQMWSLVWPRFISDPQLGIHFGRARGPMLQSVRLGLCLILGWTALSIFTVWLKPRCRFRWAIFLVATALIWPAIYFTATRSIWLGLAFSIGMLTLWGLSGQLQRLVLFAGATAAGVGLMFAPNLLEFKREFSAAETKESAYMRVAFTHVSLEMFKDKPIAGHGFNQFQVYNPPYLADRSTKIRLESIRGYVHHNGFLSLLVDLGLVGFTLYLHLLLTLVCQAIALWRASAAPRWVRGLAMLVLCFVGAHAIQMTFHEVSFSPLENSLLLVVAGLMLAASEQFCNRPEKSRRPHSRTADRTVALES